MGEYTNSRDGKRTFANGFDALAKLFAAKNSNRVILSQHPELKVWRNAAQDGVCKSSEVFPAASFAKEIQLTYEKVSHPKLTQDNEIRLVGRYLGTDLKLHLVGDVWFKQRRNTNAYASLH